MYSQSKALFDCKTWCCDLTRFLVCIKNQKLKCIVWQYSSESEKRLKNRLAGCHCSSRWLLLDYWLPENSSNRSRWRKNKCEDLPPATHGESRARPPLEIAPRTSTWCCSWGSWPGASWLRWCELTRATQHTKARPPSCGLHISTYLKNLCTCNVYSRFMSMYMLIINMFVAKTFRFTFYNFCTELSRTICCGDHFHPISL